MYHWNSQTLETDLAQIPGIASVENVGPGGDVDTDNLLLEIKGTDERLFIKGFEVAMRELPHKSDVDVEMVELTDGQCGSGGLNSNDQRTIMAYACVRTYFAQNGADVVDTLDVYF